MADSIPLWRFRGLGSMAMVLLFLSGRAVVAETVSRDINIPKLEVENVVAVEMDSDVYAAALADFADVRIVDSNGTIVPYWLRRRTESVRRKRLVPVACEIVSVGRPSKEALELTVRREKRSKPFDEIELITKRHDFEHQVQVFGSDDGQTWTPLVEDGLIFDYSRFVDFRNRKVRLPKNMFKQLKVRIDAPTQEQEASLKQVRRKLGEDATQTKEETVVIQRQPLKIERVVGRHEETFILEKRDAVAEYAIANEDMAVSEEDGDTVLLVTTRRRPIHTLALKTETSNFRRPVVVENSDGYDSWKAIDRGTLSKVTLPGLRLEQNKLRIPETRSPRLRLRIENGDNPPLEVAGIEAEGSVWECRFVAKPETSYQIRYGEDSSEKPDYDVQAMQLAYSKGIEPVAAQLAPGEGRAFVPDRGFRFRDILGNRIVFGSVVLIALILLGISLFQAAKRVD